VPDLLVSKAAQVLVHNAVRVGGGFDPIFAILYVLSWSVFLSSRQGCFMCPCFASFNSEKSNRRCLDRAKIRSAKHLSNPLRPPLSLARSQQKHISATRRTELDLTNEMAAIRVEVREALAERDFARKEAIDLEKDIDAVQERLGLAQDQVGAVDG